MLILVKDVAVLAANDHPQYQHKEDHLPGNFANHQLRLALYVSLLLGLSDLIRGQACRLDVQR